MVTSIKLGNIFQENGRTVVGGSASGIDTQSLVKALADAKRLPATKLEDRISSNTKAVEAYNTLKDTLTTFRDAANFLRNPPGVLNDSEDIFQYRSSSLTSNTSTQASTYVDVTVEPGVATQSFSISSVGSIATAAKQQTGNMTLVDADSVVVFATPSGNQFGDGALSIRNVNGGAAVSINFVAGDTLNQVAAKFNAVKDDTGIQATVVKVAEGGATDTFRLVFSATETGTAYDFDLTNASVPGTVTADPGGVRATISLSARTAPTNATFTIDGVTVTRSTNEIDDVIDGITFDLKQTTPGGTTLTLDVEPDRDLTKTAIMNFVNAYNDLRVFVSKQTETDSDGKPAETALLAGSTSLRSIMSRANQEVSNIVSGIASGDYARLSDIGITFTDYPGDDETPFTRNVLTVDEDKLTSALSANYDEVKKVFAFDMESNNPNLTVFRRTNDHSATSFTLNVTAGGTATATIGATVYTLDSSAISGGGGYLLKGRDGTPLEGLQLIYASTSAASISVTLSQGIGDRIFNMLESDLDSESGLVENELTNLSDTNTRLQKEIDRIDEIVEAYRNQLLDKYSSLESALTKANTILQSLYAQQQARTAAGG